MIDIAINGLKEVQAKVKDIQKQVNFATVKAVNRVGLQVQGYEVGTVLPSSLQLRAKGSPWHKPGSKFGVNMKFASKGNPVATVGSAADWLKLQEEGGTKKASGHRIAIPTALWKSKPQIMKAGQKPKRILNAKRVKGGIGVTFTGEAFIQKSKSGREGIWARTTDTFNGKPSIRPLFFFFDSAQVKQRLGFFIHGQKKVNEIYGKIFDEELAKAIATAK